MPIYLLDTNTVSDAIKNQPSVVRRLADISSAAMRISAITEGELLFGLELRIASKRIAVAAHEILRRVEVVSWDREAARSYGSLRARLQKAGKALTPLDMLIAAHAISLDAILVTADRAFTAISGLIVQNWREPG